MQKSLILVGGPNGCGKTSLYQALRARKKAFPFLNADLIAVASSGTEGVSGEIEAGKVLLSQLDQMLSSSASVAVETTMAGKLWSSRIRQARDQGYKIITLFVTLDTVDLSLARISKRAQEGGHFIPENTVRRRWARCHSNFWKIYKEQSDSWYIFDNSASGSRLVADKTRNGLRIDHQDILQRIESYAK